MGLQFHRVNDLLRRVLVHPVQRLHKSFQGRIQFDGLRLGHLELAGDSQDLTHRPIVSHQKEGVCMSDR